MHVHTVADKGDGNALLTDDTGDSGFSDSRAFLKDPPPNLFKPAVAQSKFAPDSCSESAYAQLNIAGMRTADYYKSLKRENIEGKSCSMHSVHACHTCSANSAWLLANY